MDDEALLLQLGVTAANAEDVERDVIAHIEQAGKEDGPDKSSQPEEAAAAEGDEVVSEKDAQRARLVSQLAAVQQEIEAVQGGLRLTQADDFLREEEQTEDGEVVVPKERKRAVSETKSLHSALACDRLKTLGLKRKQLRAQLRALDADSGAHNAHNESWDAALDPTSGLIETERDRLIRIGALTPFDKLQGYERRVEQTRDSRVDAAAASMAAAANSRPTTKLVDAAELPKLEGPTREFRRIRRVNTAKHGEDGRKKSRSKRKRPRPDAKWRKRKSMRQSVSDEEEDGYDDDEEEEEEEEEVPDDVLLEGGLRIPGEIYDKLFDYQKTGVKWLWELHCQKAGGIIGDEMGLGKTIQVIAFLSALHHSGMFKASTVICPVTLLAQWKREIEKWYPKFEVEILHDSGGSKNKASKKDSDGDSDNDNDEPVAKKKSAKWDAVIQRVINSDSGILLTTYEQLRINSDKLLDIRWGYAVLDEGHRIRNPDAETTLICKQLQTVHRIIMTGAPIQNKLVELWSLFDFVFPGKLGVLPVFQTQFADPIAIGGYANASPLQVSTAYKCAIVLRDLIMPYLLRRMKSDVEANLTKKTEHVLFCSLTEEQRVAYRAFLASTEVESIFDGTKNALSGIDTLRKICNHPDLLEREQTEDHPDYGKPERSGKLQVVGQVLKLWMSQGHRVLIFCQTQQMLDIMQKFMETEKYVYRRMDGSTPVNQRMALIDEFNESAHVFVFILTTKVGGLGTNLTGANRVIIFDPDWNPSTDTQARERAWRIGQKKDVTIYRLITRGTIEEKVYHRQIYKQHLTNKILRDPQQRRIFKARDMRDLFVLKEEEDAAKTETSSLFADMASEIKLGEDNKEGHQAAMEESRILESLFQANGIHSAMDHDAMVSVNDPERVQLNFEATRIAQSAAEALQLSRVSRMRHDVSVPTWTGHSGEAGAPRRRFGAAINSRLLPSTSEGTAGVSGGRTLSSNGLVAQMRDRALGAVTGTVERESQLGEELKDFLRRQQGGNAASATVIDHFKVKLAQAEVPIFKQVLNQVAVLKRDGGGERRWFLRD